MIYFTTCSYAEHYFYYVRKLDFYEEYRESNIAIAITSLLVNYLILLFT